MHWRRFNSGLGREGIAHRLHAEQFVGGVREGEGDHPQPRYPGGSACQARRTG